MLKEFSKVRVLFRCVSCAELESDFDINVDNCVMFFLGGLLMVPNKHKEPAKFVYNSGFFITANEYLDFGSGFDSLAIQERLPVFRTRKLPVKDGSMTGTPI